MRIQKLILICFMVLSFAVFFIQPILAAQYTYTTIDFPGAYDSYARGINDNGSIVGFYRNSPTDTMHGFIFDGSYSTFDIPGALHTWAHGINDSGFISGYYTPDNVLKYGFLYDGNDYIQIDYGGVSHTVVTGINDSGDVVGDGGFIRYADGSYLDMRYPNSSYTETHGINDNGQAVGYYVDGRNYAFLYDNGSYSTIDFIDSANDINDSGSIIGFVPGGGSYILENGNWNSIYYPGSDGTGAYGLNDKGDIVGVYTDAQGLNHGFVATVVPEPISSILFIIGGTLLAGRRYIKRKKKA